MICAEENDNEMSKVSNDSQSEVIPNSLKLRTNLSVNTEHVNEPALCDNLCSVGVLSANHTAISLPCKPEPPSDNDCCGSVCVPFEDIPCKPEPPSDNDCCGSVCVPFEDIPCKPEPPSDNDCCGSGCVPCIFDIYDQEVKIWEQECSRLKNKALTSHIQEDIGILVLSESEYRKFIIIGVNKETSDSYRYKIQIPFNRSLGLKAGQHVIIRGRTKTETITRQYTPVSPIHTTGYFDLLIKVYKEGKMSKIINFWKVGDEIEVRGPFGSWCYRPGMCRLLLMLAVGTGIAPMAQIIQTVLDNENDETFIHLLYGCRTYSDILMKKELDEWSGFWNFSVTYALSQENHGLYRYSDKVYEGRIDGNFIRQETCGKPLDKCLVLICGTRSFDDNMIHYCQDLGFSQQTILKF